MRHLQIMLMLWLALAGGIPSALASVPHAVKNPCTGDFRGVISGYRYYSPSLGRWISKDPFSSMMVQWESMFRKLPSILSTTSDPEFLPGGLNLHGFCANSPVACYDADGRFIGFLDVLLGTVGSIGNRARYEFTVSGCAAKLLYDFKDFAQMASQVGQFAADKMAYNPITQALATGKIGSLFTFSTSMISGNLTPGPGVGSVGEVSGVALSHYGVDFQQMASDLWDYIADPNTQL